MTGLAKSMILNCFSKAMQTSCASFASHRFSISAARSSSVSASAGIVAALALATKAGCAQQPASEFGPGVPWISETAAVVSASVMSLDVYFMMVGSFVESVALQCATPNAGNPCDVATECRSRLSSIGCLSWKQACDTIGRFAAKFVADEVAQFEDQPHPNRIPNEVAILFSIEQACLIENAKMFRGIGLPDAQCIDEPADRRRTFLKVLKNAQSCRLGEDAEQLCNGIKMRRLLIRCLLPSGRA